MNVDMWLGLITVLGRTTALVLCFIVLAAQIREVRTYTSLQPFRWALLGLNAGCILLAIAPLMVGIERLTTGTASAPLLIMSSVSVNFLVVIIAVALFLMYFVFNRRQS